MTLDNTSSNRLVARSPFLQSHDDSPYLPLEPRFRSFSTCTALEVLELVSDRGWEQVHLGRQVKFDPIQPYEATFTLRSEEYDGDRRTLCSECVDIGRESRAEVCSRVIFGCDDPDWKDDTEVCLARKKGSSSMRSSACSCMCRNRV